MTNLDKFLDTLSEKEKRNVCSVIRDLRNYAPSKLVTIDQIVGDLSQINRRDKLKEWFLTGDENLFRLTAERFILSYIRRINPSLQEINVANTDSKITYNGEDIGVEITTLNQNIEEAIFTHRISCAPHTSDSDLTLYFSPERLREEGQKSKENKEPLLDSYVTQVKDALITSDLSALRDLGIDIENNSEGGLVFCYADSFVKTGIDHTNCRIKRLQLSLTSKLSRAILAKKNQLAKHPQNIVFVGLNNVADLNTVALIFGVYNEVSREVSREHNLFGYRFWTLIEEYWHRQMQQPDPPNVIGICFFFYDLRSIEPFWPIRAIWKDKNSSKILNLA